MAVSRPHCKSSTTRATPALRSIIDGQVDGLRLFGGIAAASSTVFLDTRPPVLQVIFCKSDISKCFLNEPEKLRVPGQTHYQLQC
jgi:hypothetical protein